jgi:hypothetical protein
MAPDKNEPFRGKENKIQIALSTVNFKSIFKILFFPIILICWGIAIFYFFDPFFARTIDPEYPYLINGLNIAQARFNFIGHFDHPGTPFQVYNALVIKLTHLISGHGNIAEDVFTRPEFYMKSISGSLFLIQTILIFCVGHLALRRKIPVWQIVILQASFLFSSELIWLFIRVTPDRFFMIVGLIFTLVYLKHGYENRSMRKFALWSGVVMALGFATKFNFLPLLLLPLLFIDTNRNRLIYGVSGIVSFFLFILPIINRFKEFRHFITDIIKHDELYGKGNSNALNLQKMVDSLIEIIRINPGLFIFMIVLIALIVMAILKRKEVNKDFIWIFAGFLIIFLVQIVMVSKHFKNYYLAPGFVFYGFMFFMVSIYLSKLIKKKKSLIVTCSILPVILVGFTFAKAKADLPVILTRISQEGKIRNFVEKNISKDDFWFVQPTWEGAPFKENAIVYGISYCGHREEYLPQLMTSNPNIITYEYENELVKLWRCSVVNLDSVVATGKNIYIYSTPGRNADILQQLVKNAATRNNFQLEIDTVYSDPETNSQIIKNYAANSKSDWQTIKSYPKDRQSRIAEYVQRIKNSPDWLEKVTEKAKLKNIPLDSMILLDAIYMVDIGK